MFNNNFLKIDIFYCLKMNENKSNDRKQQPENEDNKRKKGRLRMYSTDQERIKANSSKQKAESKRRMHSKKTLIKNK